MKYPPTFASGGLAPSSPTNPTVTDIQEAATDAMFYTIRATQGSMFMARDFGTRASALLFGVNNEPAAIELQEDVARSLQVYFPYVRIRNLTVTPDDEGLTVEITHQHTQSLAPSTASVRVGQ
jgi:phage baseplate assembly protein W